MIGDVMVSVLASSVVDRGFEPWSGQTIDFKFVFVASPQSTQYYGERTDWLVGPESG